jgi:hypothetical protein
MSRFDLTLRIGDFMVLIDRTILHNSGRDAQKFPISNNKPLSKQPPAPFTETKARITIIGFFPLKREFLPPQPLT